MKRRFLSAALAALLLLLCAPLASPVASASAPSGAPLSRPSAALGGTSQMLYIKADGSLWISGVNENGEVGDGTTEYRGEPVKVMDGVVAASGVGYSVHGARYVSTHALKGDGTLWSWGYAGEGLPDRLRPVREMDGVADLRDGLALKRDGTLWQLRGGRGYGRETQGARQWVKVLDGVASLPGSGAAGSFAIRSDGSLWGWGGGPVFGGMDAERPDPVRLTGDVKSIALGEHFILALKNDGSVWSWGYNAVGQLGDGTQLLRAAPVRIFRDGIAKVYAGNQHALALTEGGVLWAWGFNDSGQLGDGTRVNSPSPVRVMDGVVAASAGNQPVTSDPYNFSLALKSDGSLWHWGRNSPRFRQRGVDSSVPEEVAGGVAEIGLVAGLAVMADGSLWNLGWEGTYGPPRKVMDGVRMASGASPAKPPAPGRAAPTRSEVLVNGARVDFDAYLIGGNNYFKLRDVAYALNGTAKQFSVGYDGATRAVALATGAPYSPVGGELAPGDGSAKAYSPTRSVVYVDGAEASMEVYVIGGNNYFKLRDLGAAVGFSVGYDNATRVITITT